MSFSCLTYKKTAGTEIWFSNWLAHISPIGCYKKNKTPTSAAVFLVQVWQVFLKRFFDGRLFWKVISFSKIYRIPSMYTYIWLFLMVNMVKYGRYTIHGSYGIYRKKQGCDLRLYGRRPNFVMRTTWPTKKNLRFTMMAASLFHGLWNNSPHNWVGKFIPKQIP